MTVPITIVYTPDGADQAIEANLWWIQNKTSSPYGFNDEYNKALVLLEMNPNLGKFRKHKVYKNLRKLIVSKLGYSIYYNYDESIGEILICAVWNGQRRRGPKI